MISCPEDLINCPGYNYPVYRYPQNGCGCPPPNSPIFSIGAILPNKQDVVFVNSNLFLNEGRNVRLNMVHDITANQDAAIIRYDQNITYRKPYQTTPKNSSAKPQTKVTYALYAATESRAPNDMQQNENSIVILGEDLLDPNTDYLFGADVCVLPSPSPSPCPSPSVSVVYSPSPSAYYQVSPSPSIYYQISPSPSIYYQTSPSPSIDYQTSPSPTSDYEVSPSPSAYYQVSPSPSIVCNGLIIDASMSNPVDGCPSGYNYGGDVPGNYGQIYCCPPDSFIIIDGSVSTGKCCSTQINPSPSPSSSCVSNGDCCVCQASASCGQNCGECNCAPGTECRVTDDILTPAGCFESHIVDCNIITNNIDCLNTFGASSTNGYWTYISGYCCGGNCQDIPCS